MLRLGCPHSIPTAAVATNCTDGNVRLVGGLDPTEGRVEVCMQARWSGVCDFINWNYQDAFVVCRQMGYPATGLGYLVMLCCMCMMDTDCLLYCVYMMPA